MRKAILAAALAFGLCSVAFAGPGQLGPGAVVLNSTQPQNAAFNVSSGTVRGTLAVTTITINGVSYFWPNAQGASSYVLTNNGSGVLSWLAGSGGGLCSTCTINVGTQLAGPGVVASSLLPSTVAYTNIANTFTSSQTITTDLSIGANVVASSFTGAGTGLTGIPGAQVGSGVPAANIASGSLGAGVIASSIAVNAVYPAAAASGIYSNVNIPAANVQAGSLGASVIASSLAVNGVTPGSYASANITIGANGLITSAANGTSGTGAAFLASSQTFTGQNTFSPNGVTASSFTGNGAALTALVAGNIAANGTFLLENGSALANLTAGNIASGGTFLQENASALTNLTPGNISAGTLPSNVLASSLTYSSQYTVPAAGVQPGSLGAMVIASSLAVNSLYPAAASVGLYPNIQVSSVAVGSVYPAAMASGIYPVGMQVSSLSYGAQYTVPAVGVQAGALGASVVASSLTASGVTAGSYTNTNLTVNAEGQITAAANGSAASTNAGNLAAPGIVNSAILPSTIAYTSLANTFTSSQTITGVDASGYSLDISSGLYMPLGTVDAANVDGNGIALTNLTGANVVGPVLTSTNIAAGAAYQMPYQTGAGATAFTNATGAGTVLAGNSVAPFFTTSPTMVGTNITGMPATGITGTAAVLSATQTFTAPNTFTDSATFTATGQTTYSIGTSSGIFIGAGILQNSGAEVDYGSATYAATGLNTYSIGTSSGINNGGAYSIGGVTVLNLVDTSSLFLGPSAGAAAGTSHAGSTFLGYKAGAIDTAGANTYIGFQAGQSNTSGGGASSPNVYIGYEAGQSATGAQNTIIGGLAGIAALTTSANTFVGYKSGTAATSSQFNTAIGYQSFTGQTTLSMENVALGMEALGGSGTASSSNTAVGFGTGQAMSGTSSGNTLIGWEAGSNLTSASNYNIFIGYNAAQAATTPSYDLYIGTAAMASNTNSYQTQIQNWFQGDTYSNEFAIDVTTQSATLFVNGASGASAPTYTFVASTTTTSANYALAVTTSGMVGMFAGTPSVSSCGTGSPSVAGSNQAGVITEGTTATGCVLTFKPPFNKAPVCSCDATTAISAGCVATATTLTVANTSATGDIINYLCFGN